MIREFYESPEFCTMRTTIFSFMDLSLYRLCVPVELRRLIKVYLHHAITDYNCQYAVNLWLTKLKNAWINYGHISYWDTSEVMNMNRLFAIKYSNGDNYRSLAIKYFNEDLQNWDTGKVCDMNYMFFGAESFN